MKRILLITLLIIISSTAKADFLLNTSVFYNSIENDGSTYTQKEGHVFIGMPVAVKEQLYLGLSYVATDNQANDGGYGTTEIGPRINYYFNQDKTLLLLLAFHPYLKESIGGREGSSFLAGIGYEMKVNTNFFVGASIVHHATNLTDNVTNVKSKSSTTRPMLNFSLRFK